LLDQRVVLTVNASWRWDFGDGATLTTSVPGGEYPDMSLSHTYLSAGAYVVHVATEWTGTYSIDGGPAQAIPGAAVVRPSPPFVVNVHEARAVLVASPFTVD
jgi:PKD repeat protein